MVRLDRLARPVGHLLAVIELLEAKGSHFRSLRDPIDTTTPPGMFSLQVLGAVAQLERALIAERTRPVSARPAAAGGAAAIRGCAPAIPLPSAKPAPRAMRRISTACSPISTSGSRRCAACARLSPGGMWCAY